MAVASKGTLLAGVDALYFPFLGLTSGSTTQELVCNRTQELKEDGESKEGLVAARNVLGAGEQYGGVDFLPCVEESVEKRGQLLVGQRCSPDGPWLTSYVEGAPACAAGRGCCLRRNCSCAACSPEPCREREGEEALPILLGLPCLTLPRQLPALTVRADS